MKRNVGLPLFFGMCGFLGFSHREVGPTFTNMDKKTKQNRREERCVVLCSCNLAQELEDLGLMMVSII